MKLIKFAAAALLALSSLSASAGLVSIDGGSLPTEIPTNNDFKNHFPAGQTYVIGGDLVSSVNGTLELTYNFLAEDAGWLNKLVVGSNVIDNETNKSAFSVTQSYVVGDAIDFSFESYGDIFRSIANGSNVIGSPDVFNFAVALNTTYKGIAYDAVLFLDDTGWTGPGVDDDNHDDLVIGLNVKNVPEPSTVLLMLMGLAGLIGARRLKA